MRDVVVKVVEDIAKEAGYDEIKVLNFENVNELFQEGCSESDTVDNCIDFEFADYYRIDDQLRHTPIKNTDAYGVDAIAKKVNGSESIIQADVIVDKNTKKVIFVDWAWS